MWSPVINLVSFETGKRADIDSKTERYVQIEKGKGRGRGMGKERRNRKFQFKKSNKK